MQPYSDSIEHLRDEISRLDLLLRRAVLISRQPGQSNGPDEFRGLVVTENEIEDILRANDLLSERWERAQAREPELSQLDQELDRRRKEVDSRIEASQAKGIYLALPAVAAKFALSQAEVDILLVALGSELEPQYETLYAYLHNDVTRKHPSVNLALNLVCRSEREKLNARSMFASSSRLLRNRLLSLGDETHDREPSLLRKFLKMDEAVVSCLLDQQPATAGSSTLIAPEHDFEALELEPADRTGLENLASHLQSSPNSAIVVHLSGASDAGLRETAEALCAALSRRLLFAELHNLDRNDLPVLLRDAALCHAILALHAGTILEQESEKRFQMETMLWGGLRHLNEPVLLLGPANAFAQAPPEIRVWRLDVSSPGYARRRRVWEAALQGRGAAVDAARLADTLRFGGHRVRQTVERATGLAAMRDPANPEPSTEDLLSAGRALTTPELGRFAIRVEPRYTWPDIVLPTEKMQQLRQVATWMKFRRTVHQDWGFGRKLLRGKGLIVLFTGPTGTGKTMAAEILAGELSLDLFQIDLSGVVSKYIGETEKNLEAIFRGAEGSQALLFFDEADSLFGKRTEVKDAHDRYANIEVNFLLQRVEHYRGVVVLATNLQRNLDEAFLRRIQETVEFQFPDETLRERIWRAHFPEQAPRADDIDFGFLARQFKLAGGNIKNVALKAAFRAAQDERAINMSDLVFATKSELLKAGKLCTKSDFGPYYELIQQSG
jgi:hypothetical protein